MKIMSNWYPQNKDELNKLLESYLKEPKGKEKVNGIIAPHAGYAYSGEIAGKAFSLLKNQDMKDKTAIIFAPSHYFPLSGIISHNQPNWQTPLGKIKIINNNFQKTDISQEHAIDNQIPFLQRLRFKQILPLVVGEITLEEAKSIAKNLSEYKNAIFIFSSDLSHFLTYEEAIKKDKQTIKALEKLDENKLRDINNCACGIYPLLIFIELAKLKNFKPKLMEYKNSGDITRDKESVVGYSSFYF